MAGRIALDDIDLRIISELRADGRLSVNELAQRVNVSRATAYARLDRLRSEGAIKGFTVVLDPEVIGLSVSAIVFVNVEQRTWEESVAELGGLPGVERVLLTSGEFDFALLVRFRDLGDLRDVLLGQLQTMPHVRGTQTLFVLQEHDNGLDLSLLG
ncbi:Lrp/AsnC family transcriptional regulator [Ammonicoccus fulvus]|uniref:Lrp/AsnC family transcriptional regulator n=1 Tax=Ammonicoccus fulvus TaxID=3138240 RepID=A0ABZ3FSN0_9ACTN